MRYLYVFLMLVCSSLAVAQLTVETFTPANNSTNVPLTTSVTLTFSAALDTTYQLGPDAGIFTNIENSTARYYSADRRTVTFDVELSPATVYLVCVYFARGEGGTTLQTPFGFMFTTGSSFPPFSVSGNVLGGSTGVSPAHSLVLLSTTPIGNSDPTPISGVIADGAGGFILPHVPNGTYYPVAAKDANGDGNISPENGDVVAFGDSVVVNNANVTGVNLTFMSFDPIPLAEAIHIADSISATLPLDKSLRYLSGHEVDTLGRAGEWEFLYLRNSGMEGFRITVRAMDKHWESLDSSSYWWLNNARALSNPGLAANSSVFLAGVENNGGREFRTQHPGGDLQFQCQVNLGDMAATSFWWLITDPTQDYWGARYSWGYDSSNQWVEVSSKSFIGNYFTGAIITVTGVEAGDKDALPSGFNLSQNYPNPFNPATHISYQQATSNRVTLRVYDLLGREVALLVDGVQGAGRHTVSFDASSLTSGVYFYRLNAGGVVQTKKMVLMR